MHWKTIVASLIALFFLAPVWAFGASGDEAQTRGMIISRTGETLIVNGPEGQVPVLLTDDTKTKDDKGLFGLEKDYMANTVLIPGLKVKVEGVSAEGGGLAAKTITVDGDDLETAEMIQSGLHPTAEQVAANQQNIAANQQNIAANQRNIAANQQYDAAQQKQIEENVKGIEENTNRFMTLAEYDVKGQATVKFPVSSSTISAKDQAELKKLAYDAVKLTGYIVEVTGFADMTGSAVMNTKLSENRAKAVVAYLFQQCGVPMRHIVAPGAMGEYKPAASNETKAGRAENRRVEVKILVNKGITGS
jgi:outer membrane protein OmpA-like peptidoglycan-associated protein